MHSSPALEVANETMWALVERHTGIVRYKRGVKASGLSANPPVIDCSGWAALLLASAMQAVNLSRQANIFSDDDIKAIDTWSDNMIAVLEQQTRFVLEGGYITAKSLPPLATIGLQQGGGAWASNHPRPRGITHVVQLVRRPLDGAQFVSESQGWADVTGLRLLPLEDWLAEARTYLAPGKAWAVDAFARLGNPQSVGSAYPSSAKIAI